MGLLNDLFGGGRKSAANASATMNVVSSAVQNTTQNCFNYVNSENQIAVVGNGNVVNNVSQSLSVRVDSRCAANATQDAQFQTSLQNSVAQAIKDQSIALTQWMDSSRSNINTAINQSIATNVSSNTVQSCVNSLDARNILNVQGDSNVIKDVVQTSTANLLSQCLLSDGQVSSAVNEITNDINQHSESITENPISPLTDAWTAMSQSAMAIAAVIFIVVICFVMVFLRMGGGGSGGGGGDAAGLAAAFKAAAKK